MKTIKVTQITLEQYNKLIDLGYTVIFVSSAEQIRMGFLKSGIMIPRAKLDKKEK